jgi:hypothetical protein
MGLLVRRSGRKTLAALGAAASQNIAATHRRHTGTEAMAALADNLGRLIGTLHVRRSVLWLRANVFNNIPEKQGMP